MVEKKILFWFAVLMTHDISERVEGIREGRRLGSILSGVKCYERQKERERKLEVGSEDACFCLLFLYAMP